MIASLALAGALASMPDGPGFRLALRAEPGSTVVVRAQAPNGWLASFCSARICAVGHITVIVPATGYASVDLRMHDVANGSHGRTLVTADGQVLALTI